MAMIDFKSKNGLVDPSHSTSDPLFSLLIHFWFTSGSLPVHLGPIDGLTSCLIIQFFKKKIAKFADISMEKSAF